MRALIGFFPVALERWVRAAVGPLPFDVAPVAILGALALVIAPVLSAGSEKELVPVTSTEMVDRSVATTVTYVTLPGLALTVDLPAPGRASGPPYGLLVRDSASSDAFTVVAADDPPSHLRSRWVTGRVTASSTAPAAAALAARGESTIGLEPDVWLVEVPPPDDEPITEVRAVAELAGLAEGTLVRIPLAFSGESVAACALTDAGCPALELAVGDGVFVQLARGFESDDQILVQTGYPSSVVPGRWTGTQLRNQSELEAFADSLPVHALAGWGRILVLVSIVHDPYLVRDRLWLGTALLLAFAGLLWLGGRQGYPFFRPAVEGSRRWQVASAGPASHSPAPARAIPVRVSGHAVTMDGHQRHFDEVEAALEPPELGGGAQGRATAVLRLADGAEIALAAYDTGSLGRIERGEVIRFHGALPALWAHWFGTDLRLTFESTADRDRAASLASRPPGP